MSNNSLAGVGGLLQGFNQTFWPGWDRVQAYNERQRQIAQEKQNAAAMQQYAQNPGAGIPAVEGMSPGVLTNMLSLDMQRKNQAQAQARQAEQDRLAQMESDRKQMQGQADSMALMDVVDPMRAMQLEGAGNRAQTMRNEQLPSAGALKALADMRKPDSGMKPFSVGGTAVFDPQTRQFSPNPYTKPDEAKEDPRLGVIRQQIQSLEKQTASIMSGEGIAPGLQPGDPKALALLRSRAMALAKQYVALNGDPADLGLAGGNAPGGDEDTGPKELDEATAMQILGEADGDRDKAREIARKRGYSF